MVDVQALKTGLMMNMVFWTISFMLYFAGDTILGCVKMIESIH